MSMCVYTLERSQVIPRPIDQAFGFFADPENLQLITPAWLRFQIVSVRPIKMHPGALIEYRLRWRGVPIRWLTEIRVWEPPLRFVDVQLRGPYRMWEHEHTFVPMGKHTIMRDVVRYALPWGLLGRLAHYVLVREDLNRIFNYRSHKTTALLGCEWCNA